MSEISALYLYRIRTQQSLAALGRLLGVNKSSILRWEDRRVPAERVLDVERATGVPRHELRPDLYPSTDPGRPIPTPSIPAEVSP
ncbi:MAG: Rha family transcriptional regulator [Ancylobacter novellus]|uniref:Rha family transcriptional regulator n=1 Tax=Ancylobacter novellus TaxID=921 RepID=A0A2W5RB21_ANCNO|nr:MAG: Rha family transcriptional regulator [Ancylobacter novellus]